jgi:hypothetical protein
MHAHLGKHTHTRARADAQARVHVCVRVRVSVPSGAWCVRANSVFAVCTHGCMVYKCACVHAYVRAASASDFSACMHAVSCRS